MNKALIPVFILVIFAFIPSALASPIDVNVPPTRAFAKISTGSNHVTAKNYLGQINVTCNGITCSLTNGTTAPSLTITGNSPGVGSGSYNETLANGTLINSGGSKLNFINGTGNPLHIVNAGSLVDITVSAASGPSSVTINGITGNVFTIQNVTINGHTGQSFTIANVTDIDSAPKVSINGNNRTTFTGVIANQTFAAPKVSINGNNRSSFTSVLNSTSFKVNNITCSNQFISAFSNSTGLFTCSTPTSTISINGLSRSSFTGVLANQTFAAPKVSINGNNRSSFSGIIANQTFAAPKVSINGNNRSSFTGVIANQTFAAPQITINGVNSSSHTIGATSPISISNSSSIHTISCSTCLTTSSAGAAVTLGSNLTSSSTSAFTHIWNIAMSKSTGNRVSGVLIASTNTAGAAVQVGANMSSTAHSQGVCQFSYDSAATTLTTFASVLTTSSSDSAWTTILAGANQPYPINFDCTVDTDATGATLQLNFQAEVASTVSIKAGSSYIKTP